MKEKINVAGKVKSVSDPFLMDHTSLHLITVETERGLFSIPVERPDLYELNENVKLTVVIESKDKRKYV